MTISFRPLTLSDIPLIHKWFNKPHVQRYYSLRNWSQDEVRTKLTPYINGEKTVTAFVIYQNCTAVGYIQYYPVIDYPWPNQNLTDDIIQHAAGIDFFIGDERLIGRGLGTLLLQEILNQLIWPAFDYCVVDPDVENQAMIRCNEKVGFKMHKTISTTDTLGKPVELLLMIIKKHHLHS